MSDAAHGQQAMPQVLGAGEHPYRVTVVMPCLNQAAFVEKAVRSVLSQADGQTELLVMDGLSSDGTQAILARLQVRYPGRLRWWSQADNGPAQALNRAMALAQGEMVGWLNADDLYQPGAVAQALAHLDKHPGDVMVYALGRHVDAHGAALGPYPTLPPDRALAGFVNGSGICQPTVFMRRWALAEVGPLDESLKTAFDFEWWWRWFHRFEGRIGFVRRVWAASRLHPACLTQRLRRTVALEGMQVVARHAGTPPQAWLWTHVNELCDAYPMGAAEGQGLVQQVQGFLQAARAHYPDDVLRQVLEQLRRDSRLRLAQPGLMASVEPDGWVSRRVFVRYRWRGKPARAVLMHCDAAWPLAGRLRLRMAGSNGAVQHVQLDTPGDFVLRFEVPAPLADGLEPAAEGYAQWQVDAHPGFVPAEHSAGSDDKRRLAFRVLDLQTTDEHESS